MKYKSIAYWPRGTFSALNDVSTDTHDTLEQANVIADKLFFEGNSTTRAVWVDVVRVDGKPIEWDNESLYIDLVHKHVTRRGQTPPPPPEPPKIRKLRNLG